MYIKKYKRELRVFFIFNIERDKWKRVRVRSMCVIYYVVFWVGREKYLYVFMFVNKIKILSDYEENRLYFKNFFYFRYSVMISLFKFFLSKKI